MVLKCAADTSLLPDVGGTASVLRPAVNVVTGVPVIYREEKMVYMLLSKPFF